MESSSIRIYERIMRKKFFNNLAWLLFICFSVCEISRAAYHPYFLVLSDSIDFTQQISQMEKMGVHIRHMVPPRLVEVDLPSSLQVSNLNGVSASFSGVVPLSEMEPLGPLAVAAGIRWNKGKISQARTVSRSGMGAMSASVVKENLPPPASLQTEVQGRTLSCSWKPVRGGLVYGVQLASDPQFSNIVLQNYTDRTMVQLPLPTLGSIYMRVQAVDRPDANDSTADLIGAWSDLKEISVLTPALPETGLALVPTSPAEGMESTGFSVVLEWIEDGAQATRVQVSKSASFDSTMIDEVIPGGAYGIPSSAFHVGDILYWRVQRWTSVSSPWSNARSFKIGAPRSSMNDVFINPESPQ